MMKRLTRTIGAVLGTLLFCAYAKAQPASKVVLPGENPQIANRLRAVDKLWAFPAETVASSVAQLAQGHGIAALTPVVTEKPFETWEHLADEYYAILLEAGDSLVTLPENTATVSSIQVRRLCQQRLASLPRSILALYRDRVDAEAQRLLELGRRERSAVPLSRLIDERFASSFGDRALDLLGDLAFERGQFEEARAWWSMLVPLSSESDRRSTLRFPDPKVDLIRVQAKHVLSLAFEGQVDAAQTQLNVLQRSLPEAHGWLAGRAGPYAKTLRDAMNTLVKQHVTNNDEAWTTFGGNDARNRVLTVCPPARLWEDGPAWSVKLPARSLASHPVIVNQQVLLADNHSVTSVHLLTGQRLFHYELKAVAPAVEARGTRFTLTVDQTRAYARLGQLGLSLSTGGGDEGSYLVCLDLTEPGRADRRRELWKVRAQTDEGPAFFEGAPLVREGRVFIAQSRLVGRRVVTAIVCYDALGRLRYARDVCDCPEFDDQAGTRYRHHLLTWAGNQLVYCSHSGAVVAVEPATGQPLWAMRYPSRGPLTGEREPSPRDLAPCVYHGGRLYVAPGDSDRLYCMDAATGRLLWEREGPEIVQLLGVARERVVVTTRHGLQAIDALTGHDVWMQPSDGRLPGLGRGLLAGSWVLWPTRDTQLPMRGVVSADGQLRREGETAFAEPERFDLTQLRRIPAGNFAMGYGCLVVAGAEELVAFVPSDRVPPAVGEPLAGRSEGPPLAASRESRAMRNPDAKPRAANAGASP